MSQIQIQTTKNYAGEDNLGSPGLTIISSEYDETKETQITTYEFDDPTDKVLKNEILYETLTSVVHSTLVASGDDEIFDTIPALCEELKEFVNHLHNILGKDFDKASCEITWKFLRELVQFKTKGEFILDDTCLSETPTT